MAENKRYYYLKLEEDYFTNKVQKALRKLPSGAEMCLCYLKMQLLGLRSNGVLVFDGIYDSFEEEIAQEIDEDDSIVKLTLGMLRKWNLIYDESDSQIYMQEMQGRFGSTSEVAQRVAKHREKQKLLHCNNAVTKSNAILDIELDIDKELDKDINTYAQSDSPNHSMPEKQSFITLTLNDKSEYTVDRIQVQEWQELYPAVDVEQELKKMKGWLNANPTKRKTRRGIMRFINNWLSREQDKGYVQLKQQSQKQLPSWYNNQDEIQHADEELDEDELQRNLAKLGKT